MAKRRQNGEGTIYQRSNGLWVCEITLGYDKDGKRQKKTVSSMNLEKLKKKLNDMRYLNDRNMVAEPSKYTVAEWVAFWLETYKRPAIKATTYDMYYGAYTRYIEPNIGHYKLDALNPVIIQTLINDLAKKSLNKSTGLSQSSLKKILITISQAYDKAISLNMLYQNPCKDVILPRKKKRKALPFTEDEQKQFISCCINDTTYEHMFVFAFYTGLRLGELQALTWDDVNDDHTITVSKNLSVVNTYSDTGKKNKTIIDTPKTKKSQRIIPLNKKAQAIVASQKQNNEKQSPFVFYSAVGTTLNKRSIYRSFKSILGRAGIESRVTVHSLRHSFATRLLEKGADIKTVSELLGHKSIQITLDIYSHVSGNLKTKTVNLLDD